jgi:hypothetical protein
MARHRRAHNLRHRGAAIGRSLAAGMKGTVVGGGTGAATFFVHDFAQKNVEFLGKTPYVAPLLLLGVGHVMKQRGALAGPGMAVCGAAGYALGNALSFMFATKKAAAQQAAAQQPAASQTSGLMDQDTGALLGSGGAGVPYDVPLSQDTGALISSADTLGM